MRPILTAFQNGPRSPHNPLYFPYDFGDLQEDVLSIYILTLTKCIRQDFRDGVLFGKISKINGHLAKSILSALWLAKLVLFVSSFTERL